LVILALEDVTVRWSYWHWRTLQLGDHIGIGGRYG